MAAEGSRHSWGRRLSSVWGGGGGSAVEVCDDGDHPVPVGSLKRRVPTSLHHSIGPTTLQPWEDMGMDQAAARPVTTTS
ncbi:Os11g0202900 [Oryza sativa Japonica Group]|uniref:Os11g0202900 protein n=1 Tax=Oryza sativa subsp. japonica TaxID=39947 RepID=A0A0P0Y0A1_ORYSJ|nr:Os11g0202900 [Oryza sativa Japonica Group]